MTEVLQIVSQLEEAGGSLALDGERILYSIPSGNSGAQGLLAELRKHRNGVRELLLHRVEMQQRWLAESLDAERRFAQPHAKLFPFIGRKVTTPAGTGTLLQVFAERVTVLLDSELDRCSFFPSAEIEPVSWELP